MENKSIFRIWMKYSMRDFHVIIALLAVATHVIGNISKNSGLFIVSDVIALFAIFHFLIHGYFHRQYKFLTDNQRVYSLPQKKINANGRKLLGIFLIAVSIGMAVVKELYRGTLVRKFKVMVYYILAKIFGKLIDMGGLKEDEHILGDQSNLLGVMNQVESKTDSPWEQFLSGVQTVLIILGFLLVIVLIVSLIVNAVRRKGRNLALDEAAEGRDVKDREMSIGKAANKSPSVFDFSPAAKVRRAYRKSVNKYRKHGQSLSAWMTPTEIETAVSMSQSENYKEFHEIYEKARYSEQGCTEEDANRLKSLKM